MKVGEALQNVVSNARQEGRLVAGITQMASVLERFSHSVVMMCIVETKIVETMQMKLLEAFFTEHNIKVIKVDNCSKLLNNNKELGDIQTDSNHDMESWCNMGEDSIIDEETDTTCLLLTNSKHLTEAEEFVLSFYDTFRNYVSDQYPILNIENKVLKCQ